MTTEFQATYKRLKAWRDALRAGKRAFRQKASPWNQATLDTTRTHKFCKDCGCEKPVSEFYKSTSGKINYYCKAHQSARNKKSYNKRKAKP